MWEKQLLARSSGPVRQDLLQNLLRLRNEAGELTKTICYTAKLWNSPQQISKSRSQVRAEKNLAVNKFWSLLPLWKSFVFPRTENCKFQNLVWAEQDLEWVSWAKWRCDRFASSPQTSKRFHSDSSRSVGGRNRAITLIGTCKSLSIISRKFLGKDHSHHWNSARRFPREPRKF